MSFNPLHGEHNILNIIYTQYKSYNNKFPYNTTYELLHSATKAVPGGAIDHDYPLAFNMDLKNTLNIKYKVLNIKKNKRLVWVMTVHG